MVSKSQRNSRRPLFSRATYAISILAPLLLSMLVACTAKAPDQVGQDFRTSIATSMTQAAERAGVKIFADEIAIATRGDLLIANAIVDAGDVPDAEQKQRMFFYISIPQNQACVNNLTTGYYIVERITEPDDEEQRAQLVNAEGVAVAEVQFHEEVIKVEGVVPQPDDARTMIAEASIEQSMTDMSQTTMLAHYTDCYDLHTWYWRWIVV
jgi:hypothetical protein